MNKIHIVISIFIFFSSCGKMIKNYSMLKRDKFEEVIKNGESDKLESMIKGFIEENQGSSHKLFESRDNFGLTIFDKSITWGSLDIIKIFLKYKINKINSENDKISVIKAAELNRVDVLNLLKHHGFKLNFTRRGIQNYSIMHIGFRKGLYELLQFGLTKTSLPIYWRRCKSQAYLEKIIKMISPYEESFLKSIFKINNSSYYSHFYRITQFTISIGLIQYLKYFQLSEFKFNGISYIMD